MQKIYMLVDTNSHIRKIAVDLPFLYTNKKLRLLKDYFEEGLYLLYMNKDNIQGKYFLTKDKIINEDEHHYYFKFPFKFEQVEKVSI